MSVPQELKQNNSLFSEFDHFGTNRVGDYFVRDLGLPDASQMLPDASQMLPDANRMLSDAPATFEQLSQVFYQMTYLFEATYLNTAQPQMLVTSLL